MAKSLVMGWFCLPFEKLPNYFSQWPYLFTPSLGMFEAPISPHLSPTCYFLILAILISMKWYLIVLSFHFLKAQWCWTSFHEHNNHFCLIFFEKCLSIHLLKKMNCLSFFCCSDKVCYIFQVLSLYQLYNIQIFSPTLFFVFYFIDNALYYKNFFLILSKFNLFSFLCFSWLDVESKNSLPNPMSQMLISLGFL